jgi:hypothetical protein
MASRNKQGILTQEERKTQPKDPVIKLKTRKIWMEG